MLRFSQNFFRQSAKLVALLFGTSSLAFANAQPSIVVVANLEGVSSISQKDLVRVFRMTQQTWDESQKIRVFSYASDSNLFKSFSKEVLNLNASQLRREWNRRVFTGLGEIPIEVATEQEMIERIKQTPGSIGYVYESSARASQVNFISIE